MGEAARLRDERDYLDRLEAIQDRLLAIQQAYLVQGRRAVVVVEGTDAAGKGGAIRRLTERLDPRFCKVWPIGAPNAVERGRHWLERFWAKLPEPGTIAVFDRSWYGRVLVERVEQLCPPADWRRAYREIAAFERMLVDDGIRLTKHFMSVSAATQATRFVERLSDPLKRWKITARDFEARRFADAYREAERDMLRRTTEPVRRHEIDGESKWIARLALVERVAEDLADGVDLAPPPLDPELARLARELLGVDVTARRGKGP
jgi:polyphosphate kinase 2 (PPK2 family)